MYMLIAVGEPEGLHAVTFGVLVHVNRQAMVRPWTSSALLLVPPPDERQNTAGQVKKTYEKTTVTSRKSLWVSGSVKL